MKKLRFWLAMLAVLFLVCGVTYRSHAQAKKASDRAEIEALEQRFINAFKAKDLNGIMSVYVPDRSLFVFDVIPPRQYVGFEAYKRDWQDFLALFDGPITVEFSDLDITADGRLAYGHSIQRVAGKTKDGKTLDITVRVTDGYRKEGGKWLVAHEHVSVPVDVLTGQADLSSKP